MEAILKRATIVIPDAGPFNSLWVADQLSHGGKRSKNAGEVAITDFMTSETGLIQYLTSKEPVVVLFEDSDIPRVRLLRKPPNPHLLSTVAMLRGLEEVHVIESADVIINEMLHPSKPDRRGKKFTDLPDGIDEPATIGSTWKP